MPFAFMILGIAFIVVAINGTQGTVFNLLKSEFTGSNSFLVWASSIIILGAIGYIKPIKPIADAFIGLVILVLILSNKNLFAQFNNAIRNPTAATPSGSGSSLISSLTNTLNSLASLNSSTSANSSASTSTASPLSLGQIGQISPLGEFITNFGVGGTTEESEPIDVNSAGVQY